MRRRLPLDRDISKLAMWKRRRSELKRSRLRPVGAKRRRDRRLGLVDGPLCEKARKSSCAVTGLEPTDEQPNHPHHVQGGYPRKDWVNGCGNVIPLAPGVHRDWHALGPTRFEAKYGWTRDNMLEYAHMFGEAFNTEEA